MSEPGSRPETTAAPTEVLAIARAWLGTPYRHQASQQGVGCDCLGLIRGIWRQLHGPEIEPVPPYSPDWAEATGRDTLVEAAERHLVPAAGSDRLPGDVLLFRWRENLPAKHLGIVSGPGCFIHAYEGAAVVESPLGPWWDRRVSHVFRFPAPAGRTVPTA